MKLAVIIFNSQNRKSYFLQNLDLLIKGLNELGYKTEVRATLSSTDVVDYITALTEVELLVGAGGDGTIHEIVNAVSSNDLIDPKVLFYPTGTVNDFATSLRLQADIESGLELVRNDKFRRIDSCLIDDQEYFNYVCAFGPFTSASYQVSHELKRDLGAFAYILKGFTDVPAMMTNHHIKVIADGREFEGDYNFGMLVNSHSVGGFKHVFRSTDITDGDYTLFLLKASIANVSKIPRLLLNGIGEEYIDNEVVCINFKHIEVEAGNNIAWTVDGERGPVGNFKADVIQANVKIYTEL